MTRKTRWIPGVLVGLLIAVASPVLLAQDDAEEESSRGHGYLEAGAWGPTVSGVQDEPATQVRYTATTINATILGYDHEPEVGGYFRGGYEMHKNLGEFMFTWFDTQETLSMQEFTPGELQFGEILAFPPLAGYLNDGVADGFASNSTIKLTDFRFDYGRYAFRSDRFIAKWFVGFRRVQFVRELDAVYEALAPPVAPLIPPVADATKAQELTPLPDEVRVRSAFVGRGLEFGMDMRLPLVKNKRLQLNAGFALAVLRGKVDSDYSSSNAFYVFEAPAGITMPAPGVDFSEGVMTPPYDFEEVLGTDNMGNTFYRADGSTQSRETYALATDSRSTTTPVIELYLGLNWRVWRGLEVFIGYRDIYYGDAAVDLRPKVTATLFGVNVQDVTEVPRSVSYEGLYLGVGYRF